MYIIGVLVCLQFLKIHGFNFDTNNPMIFVDPEKTKKTSSSYFGYTVVLFPGNSQLHEKWIKIGAPKGTDPKLKYKSPGVVYNCPYMGTCSTVDVHKGNQEPGELLTNAWIGGTMDIHYKFNRLAICAFRKVTNSSAVIYDDYDYLSVGSCYLSYFNDTYDKEEPLNNAGLAVRDRVYHYGHGQAGFSAHFPIEKNSLILGAPGVTNWAGTVIEIIDTEYEDPLASRSTRVRNRRGLERHEFVGKAFPELSLSFDLFGYSVNSGYFYGLNDLYYVASSPRSNRYMGKVAIFKFNKDQALKLTETKKGGQFGEYFGASIAVGDINNDGFDDLIVGAPFHAVRTFNEGKAYIYLGRRSGTQLETYEPLFGQHTNGQFGSSIMFLGDIDLDGYGDIAIGAPYENDFSGVLYIYKGNERGLDKQPCQIIVGKDISLEIRGFGISISRPADMDENGYRDLAVGAHLSGNAVLLRSSPIITIKFDMVAFPNTINSESESFILQTCYSYNHLNKAIIVKNPVINRTIIVDFNLERAIIFNNQKENSTLITIEENGTCENVTISLKNRFTIEDSPINVVLSYGLEANQTKEAIYISDKNVKGNDIFCIRCPILDELHSIRSDIISIPFARDCGEDNICQSNLSIEAEIPSLGEENSFIVGSMEYVNLQTTIENNGENAYSTKLEVVLPGNIKFGKVDPVCKAKVNRSMIICTVDDPLKNGQKQPMDLELDMRNIRLDNDTGEIHLRALTSSSDSGDSSSTFLKLQLKRVADVTINGKSEEQSYDLGNSTRDVTNFTQLYEVEKIGPSPLEQVLVNISIPTTIITQNGPVSLLTKYNVKCNEPKTAETSDMLLRRKRQTAGFISSPPDEKKQISINDTEFRTTKNKIHFLNCSTETILCVNVSCVIIPFEKQQVPIKIEMTLNTSAIRGVLGVLGSSEFVLYSTNATVIVEKPSGFSQIGNRPDSISVSSIFISEMVNKKKVALWIIILSGIAGLLLLILIIYALTKVGFFKRAKREELKTLKAAMEEENEIEELNDDAFEPVMNSSNEGLVEDDEKEEK